MPLFLVSLMAVSESVSRKVAAVLLLVPTFSAIWRTSWVLVRVDAMNPPSELSGFMTSERISYTSAQGKRSGESRFLCGFSTGRASRSAAIAYRGIACRRRGDARRVLADAIMEQ